ncbi:MAG: Tat pathway signal protein [Brevundimonas sp.]|nr:MAG: Tat pathway signal protein [Brevundimonas sp.]
MRAFCFGPLVLAGLLAACATVVPIAPASTLDDGWVAAPASTRSVGLGLPGGAQLAEGVTFSSGLELVADETSPLHSLSDLKISGDWFYAVSDAGDLVRFHPWIDAATGEMTGLARLGVRRLTLADGSPIVDKADGDAEGLLVTDRGDLLVSFERDHRIWNYGSPRDLNVRPVPVSRPEFDFPLNDGMEGVSVRSGGWRVAGEDGGVWDCSPAGCAVIVAPPEPPLADSDYRITGMDRDPDGGFFVVQRSFSRPIDARARVRRMAEDGTLGPVLIELKLPSTTDNFEGVAAERQGQATRLYILSDDNNSSTQRTLLLAFDVAD